MMDPTESKHKLLPPIPKESKPGLILDASPKLLTRRETTARTEFNQSPLLTSSTRARVVERDVIPSGIDRSAIGTPIPEQGHRARSSRDDGQSPTDDESFPSITVDRCDETGPMWPMDQTGYTKTSLATAEPFKVLSRSLPRQMDSRNIDRLNPTPPMFRKSSDPRVLQFHSPTEESSNTIMDLYPCSRSEGDLAVLPKKTDPRFQCKDFNHPRFQIEIDRPPTPWKSPPVSPRDGATRIRGPAPLSPLITPRTSKSLRETSPISSPRSPRRPVRLVPLQYTADSQTLAEVIKE